MNIFKRNKPRSVSELDEDWKPTGSFIKKPAKGWIHPDRLVESAGVVYQTHVGQCTLFVAK